MHEFSLMADLMRKIESVAQEQQSSRVLRIEVQLGALSHISPEHFVEHFVHVAKGTVAEGAQILAIALEDTSDPHAQDIRLTQIEVLHEER